jgi:hypothetical protein
MKIAFLVLAMASFGMIRSSHAYASGISPQQNLDTSTGAARNRPRRSDEQGNDRQGSEKNRSRSRASLIKTNRSQQLRKSREHSTTESVRKIHQTSSGAPAAVPAKSVNNRTLPVRTTGVTALNGQQFRNSHSWGAGPAIIGGPAKAARSAAVINGTSINRKRMN